MKDAPMKERQGRIAVSRLVRLVFVLRCLVGFASGRSVKLRASRDSKLCNALCRSGGVFTVLNRRGSFVQVGVRRKVSLIIVLAPQNVIRVVREGLAIQ